MNLRISVYFIATSAEENLFDSRPLLYLSSCSGMLAGRNSHSSSLETDLFEDESYSCAPFVPTSISRSFLPDDQGKIL
jgi:hypothetical protein